LDNKGVLEMNEFKSIAEAVKRTFAPETRVCLDCGHNACPHCGNWCDVIACTEDEMIERGVKWNGKYNQTFKQDWTGKVKEIEPEKFPVLCCDGGCRYE